MSSGVDYAWSRPSPASLKAAKISFVCRYLATDRSKALSATETKALAAVGIWLVVVWETSAKRMLAGKAGGVADAKAAAFQSKACGMPGGRPIYFAADWDATEAQQTAINAYLDGAASVLGAARVGIYGGYYPVKRALDAGKAAWAWQTRAWSGGQWDNRAHIRQGAYVTIGGVQCDANTSMKPDFGQWMPGKTPAVEDDMALSADDIKKVAAAVWDADMIPASSVLPNADYAKGNKLWSAHYALGTVAQTGRSLTVQVAALSAAVAALAAKVGSGDDTAAIVAAVQQAIADAVVHVQVDVTGDEPTTP